MSAGPLTGAGAGGLAASSAGRTGGLGGGLAASLPSPSRGAGAGASHQHLKNDRNSLILTKQHCTQTHDLVGSELDEVRGQGLLGLTDGLPHNTRRKCKRKSNKRSMPDC